MLCQLIYRKLCLLSGAAHTFSVSLKGDAAAVHAPVALPVPQLHPKPPKGWMLLLLGVPSIEVQGELAEVTFSRRILLHVHSLEIVNGTMEMLRFDNWRTAKFDLLPFQDEKTPLLSFCV